MRYTSLLLLLVACARSGSQAKRPLLVRADTVMAGLNPTLRRLYGDAFVDTLSKALNDGELIDSGSSDAVLPAVVYCPPLAYPETARQAGVQGIVRLVAIIDTLGYPEPGSLRVAASPHESLTAAAMHTLEGCRFTPGRFNGHAVRALIVQPFDFSITRS
jgi:TonB family protein